MAPEVIEHARDRFRFVGRVEAFANDLGRMQAMMGWERMPIPHRNAGRYGHLPDEPPEEMAEIIREANQLDQALYDSVETDAAMGEIDDQAHHRPAV